MGNTDKVVKFIDDCRKASLTVLPPDVNESGKDFRVVEEGIRFGLLAIKNVGESAIDSILASRDTSGRFTSLFDFCSRVDLRLVNRKCLESLVQAGAFDSLGGHRAQHLATLERAVQFGQAVQTQAAFGQSNLFESAGAGRGGMMHPPDPTDIEPWQEMDKLTREKAVLGFYVSGHPLLRFESIVREYATVRLGEPGEVRSGSAVRACGIVTAIRKKIDRRNNTMAFVTLEDFSGKAECIVFSDPFSRYAELLVPDALVMVAGRGEPNGESMKIIVSEVTPLDRVRERYSKGVMLSLNLGTTDEQVVSQLRDVIRQHPGNTPCFFTVVDASSTRLFQSRRYSIQPTSEFVHQISNLLGPESIRFSGGSGITNHSAREADA
jgi:DNA polymerase-3 subunit alpha